jgi:flagellar motility protein MotE (MotC chaperone)
LEVVTEYANEDRKVELEDRVNVLEAERDTLLNDIGNLKERLSTLELERRASSIAGEVEALRTEKAVLEEKIASYAVPEETQPSKTDSY